MKVSPREKALCRLPVVEGGKPVGIVSLGNLAVKQDPHSALGNKRTRVLSSGGASAPCDGVLYLYGSVQ
jgi:hypothetical protein